MRNALATAEEIGFDAPVTALFEQLYAEAGEHGLGDLDHSGLFVELASATAWDESPPRLKPLRGFATMAFVVGG